jgi:hypothetical protein
MDKSDIFVLVGGMGAAALVYFLNKKPGSIPLQSQLEKINLSIDPAAVSSTVPGLAVNTTGRTIRTPVSQYVYTPAQAAALQVSAKELQAKLSALTPGLSFTLSESEAAAATVASGGVINSGSIVTKNSDGSTSVKLNAERVGGKLRT